MFVECANRFVLLREKNDCDICEDHEHLNGSWSLSQTVVRVLKYVQYEGMEELILGCIK